MANALNDQVLLKQTYTNVEKAEDAKFVEMQRNEQRKWEEEQKLLAIHEIKKTEQLKKVRQDEIEESVQRHSAAHRVRHDDHLGILVRHFLVSSCSRLPFKRDPFADGDILYIYIYIYI